jgi:hypothetical protein
MGNDKINPVYVGASSATAPVSTLPLLQAMYM